ncbi:MAG: hypothetical protein F6K09_01230 [Merismopedia sp. SIO2A8]|nr:hypothetical protein [Symploca sp. SIO2B6]NET47351.1 hypothetical protein [Merismopedia sp. SIO2A8]
MPSQTTEQKIQIAIKSAEKISPETAAAVRDFLKNNPISVQNLCDNPQVGEPVYRHHIDPWA